MLLRRLGHAVPDALPDAGESAAVDGISGAADVPNAPDGRGIVSGSTSSSARRGESRLLAARAVTDPHGGRWWRDRRFAQADGVVVMAYRLRAGDTGPVQQSPVTCGSACLTVARMHVDPQFASWVRTGLPDPPGSPEGSTPGSASPRTSASSCAAPTACSRGTVASTSLATPLRHPSVGGPARLPEYGAARRGTEYTLDVLRTDSRRGS